MTWLEKLAELEEFFAQTKLPKTIRLSHAEVITDVDKFVKSHLLTAKTHVNNQTFRPYMERMILLKNLLTITPVTEIKSNLETNKKHGRKRNPFVE